ncbi:MAG: hypothetical protein QXZ17_04825, partial [Nitrososphaerota archaeon]
MGGNTKELCEVKGLSQIQNIFKGPPRPSSITGPFGKLVREGVYIRVKREPKYLYYICRKDSKHKGLATLNGEDNELISKIEKVIILFQYPTTSLSYPNGKLFDTARPDSLYIGDEKLSTWTKEEFDNKSEKVHHLFTKRNLLALSILFWSIENVKDFNIRERLLLAFTSTLLHCSKMISGQLASLNGKWKKLGGAIWMTNRFSIPPDFKEANVSLTFEEEFARIYDANDEALSNKPRIIHKPSTNHSHFSIYIPLLIMTPFLAAIVIAVKMVAGTEITKALGHETTRSIRDLYNHLS